jgi:hypothetical protein
MESPDMLGHQLARLSIALVLVIFAGTAFAEDFSKYKDESALLKVVRDLPASNRSANAVGYARLLALDPNNEFYWAKFERYSGRDESALLKVVKGIPASNRSANAVGYARLLALVPNSEVYRAKFERYSGPAKRLKSVNSVSDLRSFLAGSWCVLDNNSGYVSGPYVEKLVVLKNGNYTLFSKQASALVWDDVREKGKFKFGEGRHSNTGEKYFSATPEVYGLPKLLIDAGDFTVSWQRGTSEVAKTVRNSCRSFE